MADSVFDYDTWRYLISLGLAVELSSDQVSPTDLRDLEGLKVHKVPRTTVRAFQPQLPAEEEVEGEESHRLEIELADGSRLVSPGDDRNGGTAMSAVGPALRNLASAAKRVSESRQPTRHPTGGLEAVGGWTLRTTSRDLLSVAQSQSQRAKQVELSAAQDLANSAYYMGSKRGVLPFILEALDGWAPNGAVYVDLMCGSGAVSGALSKFFPTMASDAMSFCRTLAVVQGGGYSERRARHALDELRVSFEQRLSWLNGELLDALNREDAVFFSNRPLNEIHTLYLSLLEEFAETVQPLEQKARQSDAPALYEFDPSPASPRPHLFTTYYANLFIGIRQATEIDALRGAIDTLSHPLDRLWALGALIATVSSVATSYGGHFAQPIAAPSQLKRGDRLARALKSRARSVRREFEARFLALASASEGVPYAVDVVEGPWQDAVATLRHMPVSAPRVIYVDAPYRREEYSRYYHLLETLSRYDYPPTSGSGRIPTKSSGHRFASEFFTRNHTNKVEALAAVIKACLETSGYCAWSYSSVADVRIIDVIDALSSEYASLKTVAAKHTYRRQGKNSRSQPVSEYLLMFARD